MRRERPFMRAIVPIVAMIALLAVPAAGAAWMPFDFGGLPAPPAPPGDSSCTIPEHQNLTDLLRGVARVCETRCVIDENAKAVCVTRNATLTSGGFGGFSSGFGSFGRSSTTPWLDESFGPTQSPFAPSPFATRDVFGRTVSPFATSQPWLGGWG